MTVHLQTDTVTVHHGDSLDVLRTLPDCSVDAVVTDPPYGLEFMGKDWDRPWAVSPTNRTGFTGRGDFTLPAHRDNRNANCRGCGGRQRGANRCQCATPRWDRDPADDMRAFQAWCEGWAAECLRILKPGGHLLAFGSTRTAHRLASGIEDAGFEIRDTITWHYGQGFPKSLNVSADAQFCHCEPVPYSHVDQGAAVDLPGLPTGVFPVPMQAEGSAATSVLAAMPGEAGRGPAGIDGRGRGGCADSRLAQGEGSGGCEEPRMERRGDVQAAEGQLHRPAVRPVPGRPAGDVQGRRVRDGASSRDGAADRSAAAADRSGRPCGSQPAQQRGVEPAAVSVERGPQAGRGWPVCGGCGKPVAPTGLGTALKPASEPIVVARKPLTGTVAQTVLTHGTGALNIDATRVGAGGQLKWATPRGMGSENSFADDAWTQAQGRPHADATASAVGRWPSNVVLSHAAVWDDDAEDLIDACADGCVDGCPVAELDAQSGVLKSGANPTRRGPDKSRDAYGEFAGQTECTPARGADSGGASRFFPTFRYQAKAPARERPKVDGIAHPTVKPVDLMRWLVRLVCPSPGGTVLEPFAGSGTTVEACLLEGAHCVAVERDETYLPLIAHRVDRATEATAPARSDADPPPAVGEPVGDPHAALADPALVLF